MSIILQDPVRLETPTRSPVRPAAPLDAPFANARVTSFDLESPGGYARTVVGRVAYLDREANTYVVVDPDGELIRVPIRDITSSTDVDDRSRESST
jgi:hypothetical protein